MGRICVSQRLALVPDSFKMQGWFWILLFVMVWTQTGASPTVTLDPEEEDPLSECFDTKKLCEKTPDPASTTVSPSNKIDTCSKRCQNNNFISGYCMKDKKRKICKNKEEGLWFCSCYAVKGFESAVNG